MNVIFESENAESPIFLTPAGISTFFKLMHPLNASPSIDVISSGIFISVRGRRWSNSFWKAPKRMPPLRGRETS